MRYGRARALSPFGLLVAALAFAIAPVSSASADACADGNRLRHARVSASGALEGERAVVADGWLLPEGRPPTQADSVFLAPGSTLRFELAQPSAAAAVYVQGDAAARFELFFEDEAGRWERVFEAGPVEGGAQRGRGIAFATRRFRAARLVAVGPGPSAISEVAVFACPEALVDAGRYTRMRPDSDAASRYTQRSTAAKLAFGLLALYLLVRTARTLSPRGQRALHLSLCALSLLAWLDFGAFVHHPRGLLHTWDSMHYFLGSKYAPETGYTRLYDCIAQSAYRRGLGEWFDRGVMRRLDDNVRVPGSYAHSADARCSVLSEARRAELDADLVALARLGLPRGMRPESITNDRGYLATPFGSAWLRVFTAHASPGAGFFLGMAALDVLYLIAAVVVLAVGIGLRPATFAAVALGVGMPWDYYWLGGALDRHSWLLAVAIALVALHRRWPVAAGVALAFAVLHRVFPIGLAGGALLGVAFAAFERRGLEAFDRRILVAFPVAMLAGVAIGASSVGWHAWYEFFARLPMHRATPVANELGGPAALRLFGGDLDASVDPGQLDALVPWARRVLELDADRLPLRLLLVLGSGGLLASALRRRAALAVTAFAGALLLASLTNVASYYGGFLVLAAALPGLGTRYRATIVLASLATQLASLPSLASTDRFALVSIALLGAVAATIASPAAEHAVANPGVD